MMRAKLKRRPLKVIPPARKMKKMTTTAVRKMNSSTAARYAWHARMTPESKSS
jgi:hypothetical protein